MQLKVKVNNEEYASDDWYGYTGNINYRNNQEAENNYKEYIKNSI